MEHKAFDIFCENCDNILDISRSLKVNDIIESDTPVSVSSTEESSNKFDYETFLKKMENGESVFDEELKKIDIKDLVQDEYYKKMQKKALFVWFAKIAGHSKLK